jgi:hypothetical protein
MQGLLTFASLNGWETGPAVIGILLAICSMLVVREVGPYENPSTNVLANLAQLQLLATSLVAYMLITELEGARPAKLVLWGILLLLVNLGTVLLAIWLQVTESNRQIVLQLMLLEREIRDAEMLMDGQSLRADIARLQRSTGMQLSVPSLKDVLPEMDDASAAAKLQGAMFIEEIEGSPIPSHTKLLYPCWVIPLSKLRKLERLPTHEDALQAEYLDELTQLSTQPSCAYSFFVSQNWEGGTEEPHPDNPRNTKLRWLCRLREHLGLPQTRELWIWFDILSVPQRDRTLQMKAIGSLCAFTHLITRFIPLVRDENMWQRLYDEQLDFPSGTLLTYSTRGWQVCSLSPFIFSVCLRAHNCSAWS